MMVRLWLSLLLATGVMCGGLAAQAQSKRTSDLAAGKLLVSGRDLADPAFAETVVLLIQYDVKGAAGLMINRRTKVPLSRALRDVKGAQDRSDPVYVGGPVEMEGVLALLRSHSKPEDTQPIFDDVYLVFTKEALEKTLAADSGPGDFHAYLGYCGWGARQLENEVRHGAWYIFAGSPGLLFDSDPDSVWSRLISRTEQQIASVGSQAR